MGKLCNSRLGWVVALAPCLVPSGAISDVGNVIPVCIGNSFYELPYQPGLRGGGRALKIGDGEAQPSSTSPPIFWRVGQPPLALQKFSYYLAIGSEPRGPILDFLLKHDSIFKISELSVYPKRRRVPFQKHYPHHTPAELLGGSVLEISYSSSANKSNEYSALDFNMFGTPIIVRCSAGLPVYSRDPSSLSCNLSGSLPDASGVYISFNVGADLDGQWHVLDYSYSGWKAAIYDVEQAIRNLIPSPMDQQKCS